MTPPKHGTANFSRRRTRHYRIAATLPALAGMLFGAPNAHSQISLDGTVGPARALSGPDYSISESMGTTVGNNLFHSFGEFNVHTGESATFTGPPAIARVLSRVTGGNASTIDGMIRSTIPGADFYLLNPAGVLFGANASLDVDGAFAVTTADTINLDDGGSFNALAPQESLLSSAAPATFGFLTENPAAFFADAGDIASKDAQSITVVAGDIHIAGGRWQTGGGQVNLISVASDGAVETSAVNGPEPNGFTRLGSISITDRAAVIADGDRGGSIRIRSRDLIIDDAVIRSTTHGALDGGAIDIALTGILTVATNGMISTATDGTGNGGDILISITPPAPTGITMPPTVAAVIDDINVTLDITHTFDGDLETVLESPDGTRVVLFAGVGAGGQNFTDTTLDDSADTRIGDNPAPFSGVFRPQEPLTALNGENPAGSWTLEITDTAFQDTGTLNTWSLDINGVEVESTDVPAAILDNATVTSSLNVVVTTGPQPGSLRIADGGVISTTTTGPGSGGAIRIAAPSIILDGGDIRSTSEGMGRTGDVTIDAQHLIVENAGEIAARIAALQPGFTGGAIDIVAEDIEIRSGGALRVNTTGREADGNAIVIQADNLTVNNATIVSETFNDLNGGHIQIHLTAALLAAENGVIATETTGNGDGGDIVVTTGSDIMPAPGMSAIISDVDITFDITHTFDSDLVAELVSPAGTRAQLFAGVGGNGQNFSGTTLDDNAATAIALGDPPFSGTFQPDTSLAIFNGEEQNGVWTLEVTDFAAGDQGTLNEWSLIVNGDETLSTDVPQQINDGFTTASTLTIVTSSGSRSGRIEVAQGQIGTATFGTGHAGDIRIETGRLHISGNSASIASTSAIPNGGDAGAISFTTGELLLTEHAEIASLTTGTGNGGEIQIDASTLTVTDGAITTTTDADGDGGDVIVVADSIRLAFSGEVKSVTNGAGRGGAIELNAGDITIFDGAVVRSVANAGGSGGAIAVTADSLVIDSFEPTLDTGIFSETNSESAATSAIADVDIAFDITHTFVSDIDAVLTSPDGTVIPLFSGVGGNGVDFNGTILDDEAPTPLALAAAPFTGRFTPETMLSAVDGEDPNGSWTLSLTDVFFGDTGTLDSWSLNIDGATFASLDTPVAITDLATVSSHIAVATADAATGGNITVAADTVSIRTGTIAAVSRGAGTGGTISVTANAVVLRAFANIATTTTGGLSGGRGGDSTITTPSLTLESGARIATVTSGDGTGGDIRVSAETVTVDGRLADQPTGVSSVAGHSGKGGNITIAADAIVLAEGAISAEASGAADAGGIHIDATTSAAVTDFSEITISSVVSGGGDIVLAAGDTIDLQKSAVTTSVAGDGGNISLTAGRTVISFVSSITTRTGGNGGVITIDPPLPAGGIIVDNSFGTELILSGPDYVVTEDLGRLAGGNLFHSFLEFDLVSGESITFTAGINVDTILARITGGNVSFINGIITTTTPGVDLYLINPAGIIFGQSAVFDGAASLAITTADHVLLDDGGRFDATDPAGSLLTAGRVETYGFAASAPSTISLIGAEITLAADADLTVAGGAIDFERAALAASGAVTVVSVHSPGEVTITNDGTTTVAAPQITDFGDIRLTNQSTVIVDGSAGGRVLIYGRDLVMAESAIRAEHVRNGADSDLRLTLTGLLDLHHQSAVATATFGIGTGGDIHINAADIVVTGGAAIVSFTEGAGDAGAIFIDAASLLIDGESLGIDTGVVSFTTIVDDGGGAGPIAIVANQVTLLDDGKITGTTFGAGAGADIAVTAESITINGTFNTGIFADTVAAESGGGGGAIAITATNLDLLNGGTVRTTSFGSGDSGNISVTADNIFMSTTDFGLGAGIFSQLLNDIPESSGGTITIDADTLTMEEGARISVFNSGSGTTGSLDIDVATLTMDFARIEGTTRGDGNGGSLMIIADTIQMENSSDIISLTEAGGDGGNISIVAAGPVDILSGSALNASTSGTGDGGVITIHAQSVRLDSLGQFVFTQIISNTALESGGGNGGNISIITDSLQMIRGGGINTDSFGAGNAGNITISAGNTELDAVDAMLFTGIVARSGNLPVGGNGGSITIDAGNFDLLNGAFVSADTISNGDAGNVTITADEVRITNGSSVDSDTLFQFDGGDGGHVTIDTDTLEITGGGRISASTNGDGASGVITIHADTITIDDTGLISASTGMDGEGGSIVIDAGAIRISGSDEERQISEMNQFEPAGVRLLALAQVPRTGIFSISAVFSEGNSGSIAITADSLEMHNGSGINAASQGFGNGGNVVINQAATISLDSFASINASIFGSGNGGTITLQADTIDLAGNAQISSDSLETIGGSGGGGAITIDTDVLTVSGRALISATTDSNADGGDIRIGAAEPVLTVDLISGGRILADTDGTGNGGAITVNADILTITGENGGFATGIFSNSADELDAGTGGVITVNAVATRLTSFADIESRAFGSGDGGSITIRGDSLTMHDHSGLVTDTAGTGDGGSISLFVRDIEIVSSSGTSSNTTLQGAAGGRGGTVFIESDRLVVDDFSAIFALSFGTGSAGQITVHTGDLEVTGVSAINTNTSYAGAGGTISIVSDTILLDGESAPDSQLAGILSDTEGNAGPGGAIDIQTGTLAIVGGAQVSASTFGSGDGGAVTVAATDRVVVDSSDNVKLSGIFSVARASGSAGDISITAPLVRVTNGSTINTSTDGAGDGGAVHLTTDNVRLENNAQIASSSIAPGNGGGGSVAITATGSVTVSDSRIRTSSDLSAGGNIQVSAGTAIQLHNSSVTAQAAADGGEISLIAPRIIRLVGSLVTAEAGNNGGNIIIDPIYVILDNSRIIANAVNGAGGDIQITTDVFLVSPDSVVSASSEFGVSGNIDIFAPDIDISGSLTMLSTTLSSGNEQLSERCSVVMDNDVSSLIVVGRGAQPVEPMSVIPAFHADVHDDSED